MPLIRAMCVRVTPSGYCSLLGCTVNSDMIFEWASSFPLVDKYLREDMPKVVDVPPIAHYMWRLGHLNRTDFFDALSPHKPPNVRPIDIPVTTDKDSIMGPSWLIRNLKNDPPDSIYLRIKLFRDFEHKSADALGVSYVSARAGSPGAREFWGTNKDDFLQNMGGSKTPGTSSLGFFEAKPVYLLGATLLCALVDWGLWVKKKVNTNGASASQFAFQVYHNHPYLDKSAAFTSGPYISPILKTFP